jgi:hypothetical protein
VEAVSGDALPWPMVTPSRSPTDDDWRLVVEFNGQLDPDDPDEPYIDAHIVVATRLPAAPTDINRPFLGRRRIPDPAPMTRRIARESVAARGTVVVPRYL